MKPNHIIRIETSQRSSILSARNDMANTVRAVFQLAGANVTFGEGYPGWKPNPHSAILEVAVESYKRLFGVDAKVKPSMQDWNVVCSLINIQRWI